MSLTFDFASEAIHQADQIIEETEKLEAKIQNDHNRKDTTKFLSDVLIYDRLSGLGKHWASEVVFDMGTDHSHRVDFVLFEPAGGSKVSDIEKGQFTCFEIKSCKEDVYSGNGLNFFGEKNYIVTTMETWKDIQQDFTSGKLKEYIKKNYPDSCLNFGIIVVTPRYRKPEDEFLDPTPITSDNHWKTSVVIPCRSGKREKSMTEMLFCMLRAGK